MKLNNKGFTLVEVLAVVVIIGIIGGIATYGVVSTINAGKDKSNKIMIDNIITASNTLYEEVYYSDAKLYQYDKDGATENKIVVQEEEKDGKTYNYIETNLQTLVSNGFLTGSENSCKSNIYEYDIEIDEECSDNNNKRIIYDPETEQDIGVCEIKIECIDGSCVVNKVNTETTVSCPESYERNFK